MTSDPTAPADREEGVTGGNRGDAALDHMPQLDALRALAALAVVLHHNLWRDPSDWRSGVRAALSLGETGVRLFFVLSGFLITGILLRAREGAGERGRGGILRAFYARRFLRIFPLYYAAVGAVALLGDPLMLGTLPWHLAYLSNFCIGRMPDYPGPPVSHLWSLSVEEQFYLCWPLLVLFVPRRRLLPLTLSTLVLAPLARLATLRLAGPVAAAVCTPSCLDTLGIGATLAVLGEGGRAFVRPCLPLGLALLGATYVAGDAFRAVFRDSAYALVFAWVVRGAASGFPGRAGRVLTWAPLAWLGTISYGIYLIHHMLPMRLPEYGLLRTLVVLAVTIPVAAASFHFFESPLNRLKRRFPYSARVAIVPLAPAPSPAPAPPSHHPA
jgi:peptidoglycan/LPS O-acetylase OafA/YrhL